jgi:phosphonate transport system substrate-binding protein
MEFKREFAGSTANVIQSVLLGKADAGATFSTDLDKEPEEVRDQIRTVLATREIAPHPLGAHPRVPPQLREAVRKAVLDLAAEADGAALLKKVSLASPVAADYQRDYQALEEIDIKGLSDWGR